MRPIRIGDRRCRVFNSAKLSLDVLGIGNRQVRVHSYAGLDGLRRLHRVRPGEPLCATLMRQQINDMTTRKGICQDAAKAKLLTEKQPSLEFTTLQQLGGVTVSVCSPAADQICSASISVDRGWTVQ
jgi:hypothetical protein